MTDKRWNDPEGPIGPDKAQPGSFDNYAMTVSDARWVTDQAYNFGNTVLLEFIGRSPELPAEYADRSVRIPAGNGVKIDPNDADHITLSDGENITKFNPRSLISKLIGRALGDWNMGDDLKATEKWFDQASIWIGFGFRFTKERFEFSGKDKIVTERIFPTEYLGRGEVVSMAANNGSGPTLDKKLTDLYDQAADHTMFVAFATQLPEVQNDAEVLKAVTDADEAERRWGAKDDAPGAVDEAEEGASV
jgi:hypothetical protein